MREGICVSMLRWELASVSVGSFVDQHEHVNVHACGWVWGWVYVCVHWNSLVNEEGTTFSEHQVVCMSYGSISWLYLRACVTISVVCCPLCHCCAGYPVITFLLHLFMTICRNVDITRLRDRSQTNFNSPVTLYCLIVHSCFVLSFSALSHAYVKYVTLIRSLPTNSEKMQYNI